MGRNHNRAGIWVMALATVFAVGATHSAYAWEHAGDARVQVGGQIFSFQQNPHSFSKMPGWGCFTSIPQCSHVPIAQFATQMGLLDDLFFSSTYKTLFPQLPSFHIYTKPRGCTPATFRRSRQTVSYEVSASKA